MSHWCQKSVTYYLNVPLQRFRKPTKLLSAIQMPDVNMLLILVQKSWVVLLFECPLPFKENGQAFEYDSVLN
jgi:hypothetical protein